MWLRVAALASALLVWVTPATATPHFLLDSDGALESTLFRLEPSTGELAELGALSFGSYALAAPTDRLLYAVSVDGRLYRVDIEPFTVSEVGPVGLSTVVGLMASGGDLYATEETTSSVYRIHVDPLTTTLVGPVRLDTSGNPLLSIIGGDIAADGNHNWYLWTNTNKALYRFDVTTALATPVALSGDSTGTLMGLAFDFDRGVLVGTSSLPDALNKILTIDPATSTVSSITPCLDCPNPYAMRRGDLATSRCADGDGDGLSPSGGDCGPLDCDDADSAVGAHASCGSCDRSTGFEGLLCWLTLLSPPLLCDANGAAGIAPELQQFIAAKIGRADALVRAAQSHALGGRRRPTKRLLRAVGRKLAVFAKRTRRASARSAPPAATCLAALGQMADLTRQKVVDLQP